MCRICFLSICLLTTLLSCNKKSDDSNGMQKDLTMASEERKTEIFANFIKIQEGMGPLEVTKLIGKPDEIMPLYAPQLKNAKKIGYTYWYILERSEPIGNTFKKENIVRVGFNNDNKVIEVVNWTKPDGRSVWHIRPR